MRIVDFIGELLIHPVQDGAERVWNLCFRPAQRETLLSAWRSRRGWQHARTALEIGTMAAAVSLVSLLLAVPVWFLVR